MGDRGAVDSGDTAGDELEEQASSVLTWGAHYSGGSATGHWDGQLEQLTIADRLPAGATAELSPAAPLEHLERYNAGEGVVLP